LAVAKDLPPVLIGAEIELVDRNLSNLVEYFDFAELQSRLAKNVKSDHYKDYLQNEEAIKSLPPEIQKKLTAGLQLEKIDIALPTQSHTTEQIFSKFHLVIQLLR
jgi:hypothetical protein